MAHIPPEHVEEWSLAICRVVWQLCLPTLEVQVEFKAKRV